MPTPPARITAKKCISDQLPQTTDITDIEYQSSKFPKIYNLRWQEEVGGFCVRESGSVVVVNVGIEATKKGRGRDNEDT